MNDATLVVVPTYNEKDNLPRLIDAVLDNPIDVEVLVVDDASPDGTGDLAEDLASSDSRVHVLHRAGKLGMGTAYVEGFEWARERGYARVVQMDADFSHDPSELPDFVAALSEADLVIGSRFIPGGEAPGWGRHRILLNRAASTYCSMLLGLPLSDPTSGFRALSRDALDALAESPVRSEGFSFQIEVAFRVHHRGLRLGEHPICFIDRTRGASKLSAEIVAEALLVVPLLRLCSFVDRI